MKKDPGSPNFHLGTTLFSSRLTTGKTNLAQSDRIADKVGQQWDPSFCLQLGFRKPAELSTISIRILDNASWVRASCPSATTQCQFWQAGMSAPGRLFL